MMDQHSVQRSTVEYGFYGQLATTCRLRGFVNATAVSYICFGAHSIMQFAFETLEQFVTSEMDFTIALRLAMPNLK